MSIKNFYLLVVSFIITSFSFGQVSLEQRIAELSQQIAKELDEYQKTTIAVVEFSDLQGNVTDLGRFLAEELITKLYQSKKFKVIERQLLNKIILEQKLNLTGLIDPSSAKQLGKILGVDAICSGTITELAQSLRVNARLISTETGEIFAVASTEIFKDESVMKLMKSGTMRISTQTTETKVSQSSTETQKPKEWKVDVKDKGFSFELVGAYRNASGNVIIEILVTNISEKQQDLSLYASYREETARLFGIDGTEYWPSKLVFGAQQSSGEVRKTMAVGIPVKAIFQFENVPETLTNFTAVDIGVVSDFWKYKVWRVQLKNFSIK